MKRKGLGPQSRSWEVARRGESSERVRGRRVSLGDGNWVIHSKLT